MIIAIDFDGIFCVNAFPEIGKPNYDIISATRQLIDLGHEVILWTVRNGDELKAAVEWCHDYGLHFCAVNKPAPSNAKEYAGKYETESRKVYADLYIDDHNIEFANSTATWENDKYKYAILNVLSKMNKIIKKGEVK